MNKKSRTILAAGLCGLVAISGVGEKISNLLHKPSQDNTSTVEKTERTSTNNPSEIYAIIANGDSLWKEHPEAFSRENAEISLRNTLAVYQFLRDRGVSDDKIKLLVNNPARIDLTKIVDSLPGKTKEVMVDGDSTKENFLNYFKALKTDSNDTLIVAFSDVYPVSSKPWKMSQKTYWQFKDTAMGYHQFCFELGKLEYGKAIVIGDTSTSKDFLLRLARAGEQTNIFSEKTLLPYAKNILAAESPDTSEKEKWLLNVLNRSRADQRSSMETILGDSARIYYYDEDGQKNL